jgi:hypothetical protein
METEELVKMVIFVVVLVIMVGAVALLLTGKGMEVLDSIKNLLRFGQ